MSEFFLARVRAMENQGHTLYIELRNGQTFFLTRDKPFKFKIGSLVRIDSKDNNNVEKAPSQLWPEESWVGVVRLKLSDITIIDSDVRRKILTTRNDVPYQVGNTVEVRDSYGVVRVLSEEPLKPLDSPVVDDVFIEQFRFPKEANAKTFDDFGGLQSVVARVRQLIEIPIKYHDKLSELNGPILKGVLFTGDPGTGKTMLARIIANSIDAEFYEISGPAVMAKYYGQSEEILRKLFEHAAKQKRAIIFFDEIDSVASQRTDDSHEASRRIVSQLLTLMDGLKKNSNILVIAATNRPQDIDAALRRPGRFDLEIDFPLPNRHDRELILEASARGRPSSKNLPHVWVSQNTEKWSAAELTDIWREATLLAVTDGRSEIIVEDYIGGFEQVSAQRHRVKRVESGGNSN